MLTALLLLLAFPAAALPPADDAPDTPPACAPTMEAQSWTGIKAAFTTAPIMHPRHDDADDERGLR